MGERVGFALLVHGGTPPKSGLLGPLFLAVIRRVGMLISCVCVRWGRRGGALCDTLTLLQFPEAVLGGFWQTMCRLTIENMRPALHSGVCLNWPARRVGAASTSSTTIHSDGRTRKSESQLTPVPVRDQLTTTSPHRSSTASGQSGTTLASIGTATAGSTDGKTRRSTAPSTDCDSEWLTGEIGGLCDNPLLPPSTWSSPTK
jgi:hypothetical protein